MFHLAFYILIVPRYVTLRNIFFVIQYYTKECDIMALKNRERISVTLPIELVKELREYSEETMIPITKITEKALKEYLVQIKKRNSSPT